jgi:hypothetical protein
LIRNEEFVTAMIYRLRGFKYGGRTIVPDGTSVPVVVAESNVCRFFADPSGPLTTYFGTVLRRVPDGVPVEVALSTEYSRKYELRRVVAKMKYPHITDESARVAAYLKNEITTRRCTDIVKYSSRRHYTFVTSLSALRTASTLPGIPIRAWRLEATFASSPRQLVLIDQNVLEEFHELPVVEELLRCAQENREMNGAAMRQLRPLLPWELDEIFVMLSGSRSEFDKPDILEKVFEYTSMSTTLSDIHTLEWKRKEDIEIARLLRG